jgi:hypothetical protein
MDTFTWTSEDGNVVVGDMEWIWKPPMYGDVGDADTVRFVWFVWFHRDWIVWRDERDGVRSLRHFEHRVSTPSMDRSRPHASILTFLPATPGAVAAELRVNMDLIMEIDSDCVLSGSRVSRWDRQRVGDSTDDQ